MAGLNTIVDYVRNRVGAGVNGASYTITRLFDNVVLDSGTTAADTDPATTIDGKFSADETTLGYSGPIKYTVTDGVTGAVREHTSKSLGVVGSWRAVDVTRGWALLDNGAVRGIGDALAVTTNGTNMVITIAAGEYIINMGEHALIYSWPEDQTITASAAHATLPRIDTVVLRAYPPGTEQEGRIDLTILAGTAAASPAATALTRSLSTYWEVALAQVRVDAAVTSLATNKVTDVRDFFGAGRVVDASLYMVGDGVTDDTAGLQAAGDAAIASGSALVIPEPSVFYKITDTVNWLPAGTDTQFFMDIEAHGPNGMFRFSGANKPMIRTRGWKHSRASGVKVSVENSTPNAVVWEVDADATYQSTSHVSWSHCLVAFLTSGNGVGWRFGASGGGYDFSVLLFDTCGANGVNASYGDVGWQNMSVNGLGWVFVNCGSSFLHTGYTDTGAAVLLDGALSAVATTIPFRTSEADYPFATFPSAGVAQIDSEKILYTGKTGTTLTGCTRAYAGTVAATHSSGAVIGQFVGSNRPSGGSTHTWINSVASYQERDFSLSTGGSYTILGGRFETGKKFVFQYAGSAATDLTITGIKIADYTPSDECVFRIKHPGSLTLDLIANRPAGSAYTAAFVTFDIGASYWTTYRLSGSIFGPVIAHTVTSGKVRFFPEANVINSSNQPTSPYFQLSRYVYNLSDYAGDGGAITTAVVTAALADMGSGGGTLKFPAGNHTCDIVVTKHGVVFEGAGPRATIITGDVTWSVAASGEGYSDFPTYTSFRDLQLIGTLSVASDEIPYWLNGYNCIFDNEDNGSDWNIDVQGANSDDVGQNWLFESCQFRNGGVRLRSVNTATFVRCRFAWSNQNASIWIERSAAGGATESSTAEFIGCVIEGNNKSGVYLGPGAVRCVFQSCHFEGNQAAGGSGYGDIDIADFTQVSGHHTFENNSFNSSTSDYNIRFPIPTTYHPICLIKGNYFVGTPLHSGFAVTLQSYTGLVDLGGNRFQLTRTLSYDNEGQIKEEGYNFFNGSLDTTRRFTGAVQLHAADDTNIASLVTGTNSKGGLTFANTFELYGTTGVLPRAKTDGKMQILGGLTIPTKTGAPVDLDMISGASVGDIALDTTNNRLYARLAADWGFVPIGNGLLAALASSGTAFISDYMVINVDHTSADATNANTGTNVSALDMSLVLTTGTWKVYAIGGGTFFHSTTGMTTRVSISIAGSNGANADLGSSFSSAAQMSVTGTHVVTGQSSGTKTISMEFRSTIAGTITCTESWLAAIAIRTA